MGVSMILKENDLPDDIIQSLGEVSGVGLILKSTAFPERAILCESKAVIPT